MLLTDASVTNALVSLATHLIRDIGLAGVALLTMSSGVIGLPGSEPTMLFAGFNVFQGHLSLAGIIIVGVIGDVVGAGIAYAIGYFGRRELFQRRGGSLHMSGRRIDRTSRWFDRWGSPVIAISRLIPFARAAFPYAAGVARMPFGRFLLFATIGSILWIGGLGVLGREVGSSWQSWRHNLEYVDYVGAAAVVGVIAYLLVRVARGGGSRPTPDVAA